MNMFINVFFTLLFLMPYASFAHLNKDCVDYLHDKAEEHEEASHDRKKLNNAYDNKKLAERYYYLYIIEKGSNADGKDYKKLGQLNMEVGNIDKSIFAYEKALELGITSDPETLHSLAYGLYRQRQYEKSYNFYKKYINAYPDDSTVYIDIADVLYHLEEYGEGMLYVDKYIKNVTDNNRARMLKGELYLSQDKPMKAIDEFSTALKNYQDRRKAIFGDSSFSAEEINIQRRIGYAHMMNKEFDKAINIFTTLLNNKAGIKEIHLDLFKIYSDKNNEKYNMQKAILHAKQYFQ